MIVNIITSNKGGGAETLVAELHEIYLNRNLSVHTIYFSGISKKKNKNKTTLGLNSRSPLNIFLLRKVLKKLLAKSKNELILHSHLTWPFFYTVLAAWGLKKIKLFYTEHNTTNKRRNIPMLWSIERFFYSKYSKIICISEGTKKSLSRWVGPKISKNLITIMNGSKIYSLKKRSSIKKRLPILISIGSLSDQKNFSTVVYAVSKLRKKINKYIIVGEGEERLKIKQIIKSKQLEDKVKLVGWTDKIEKYFHLSDIQIISSKWEGFGLVAVEGMSTGLPIVASSVDGLTEVLGSNNPSVYFVKKPERIENWIKSINIAINDLKEKGPDKIAEYSRLQAKKFTLKKMANGYLQLYKK